ncbi:MULTISPECIES: helix-turn-helix domain-containing protein [unclassified Campylobacter]|uniref:helix-turn-helix domain-containing protein n=1 Tax=unclassified Campylobacter TaxID=2593542 RepID=UPI003D34AD6C
MNELGILKDVGLKEVARKTHIEPDFLQAIIEKDFQKLSRLNVAGYIKILQREYGISLDEWLAEFDEYKKQHNIDNKKPKVSPKIPAYTATGVPTKSVSGGSLGWILWLFILALFLGVAYYFDAHKYIEKLPQMLEDKNESASYTSATVVQEVKKNMNIIEENTTTVIIPKDENTSMKISLNQNLSEKNTTTSSEKNTTIVPVIAQKKDENKTEITEIIEQQAVKKSENNVTSTVGSDVGITILKTDSAVFVPKAKIWYGVIELANGKKFSRTSDEPLDIDMHSELLIVFGNGNIELRTKNGTKKFDPGRAARFLVTGGEIRSVNYDEFVKLNKGKSW